MAKNLTPIMDGNKQVPNYKYLRDKYREPVKGIFRFHEVPGGTMSFTYREFKEDQPENFTMVDGEIYTVPYGVARHLNKNCWYPVHSFSTDKDGKPLQKIGQRVRRCSFQSLEFIEDLEEFTSSGLVTVENI